MFLISLFWSFCMYWNVQVRFSEKDKKNKFLIPLPIGKSQFFKILKRHSRWRTQTLWYTFLKLASFDPLWNTPPWDIKNGISKKFSFTVGGWHNWFSKICKKQQNWPFVRFLLMTLKLFWIKICLRYQN